MSGPMEKRNSNSELLHELEAISQSLYQSHTARRTASLVLPRSGAPDQPPDETPSDHRPRSRRLSMSPFRGRPAQPAPTQAHHNSDEPPINTPVVEGKKGIWNWKPMRALSHMVMQRMGCLFSVDVAAVQGLPPSMNGLRLSVTVRKKETKEGSVQTMPARVLQGAADFEETIFIRCHVYCTGGSTTGKPIKFEPRPFSLSVIAVDAPELDFGKHIVDLSSLMKESVEKSLEGSRLKNWDKRLKLAGKAKGGELVVKLGFQIMEDGGVGIYGQLTEGRRGPTDTGRAKKQTKNSFSVPSPRASRPVEPDEPAVSSGFAEIDEFKLDDSKVEEIELPEFEIVDKGIEVDQVEKEDVSSEAVVKEVVVHDPAHKVRLSELNLITKQIEELETMIGDGSKSSVLDAEEETVTREFLQMLDLDDGDRDFKFESAPTFENKSGEEECKVFISDLGKGLGPVVQTKDGGFLAATNPFDVEVEKKSISKLAMQLSKPLVLKDVVDSGKIFTGFELFQLMAGMGQVKLRNNILSMAAMDELKGKTPEQIAFEGMASAIISGRNREGASSSAARSISTLKTMSAAMSIGRKERIQTGLWNASEDPVPVHELLSFSLQKLETMAVEALKIQADMSDEDAPFDVFPTNTIDGSLVSSTVALDEWTKHNKNQSTQLTILVVIQLRDPMRRFEAVGAPVVGILQATIPDQLTSKNQVWKYKVGSLHVGGLKGGLEEEKQRLTAKQWLVAYGIGKKGKNTSVGVGRSGNDVGLLWSMSSRIVADMWLKPMRNPDVKFPRHQSAT